MTLEKQIELLKQWHERSEMYLPIMSSEDIDRFLRWLEDYKQLKADYLELDNQIRKANTENDELKQMLRLAVDDFQTAMLEEKCKVCALEHCDYDEICKWRHHNEAIELLGGTENA